MVSLIYYCCIYTPALFSSSLVASEMRQRFPASTNRQSRQYYPYNPRHNYTPQLRQSRILSSHSKPLKTPVRSATYTKNVILVARDSSDVVPCGAKREQLHDAGQIANLVEICTAWDEEMVYRKLESRFLHLIDMNKPFPRYSSYSPSNYYMPLPEGLFILAEWVNYSFQKHLYTLTRGFGRGGGCFPRINHCPSPFPV